MSVIGPEISFVNVRPLCKMELTDKLVLFVALDILRQKIVLANLK